VRRRGLRLALRKGVLQAWQRRQTSGVTLGGSTHGAAVVTTTMRGQGRPGRVDWLAAAGGTGGGQGAGGLYRRAVARGLRTRRTAAPSAGRQRQRRHQWEAEKGAPQSGAEHAREIPHGILGLGPATLPDS
jgi:hypothetical protein